MILNFKIGKLEQQISDSLYLKLILKSQFNSYCYSQNNLYVLYPSVRL